MKLSQYSKEIWSKLPNNTRDSYKGIQLFLEISRLNVFFWQDENKIKHLIIESPSGEFKVPELHGLNFSFNVVNINNTGIKTYLDLVCTHETFVENFTALTRLILQRIDSDKCSVHEEVINEINIWRLFLELEKEGILSKDDQLGLIAELILLRRIAEINPSKSITLWRADEGEIDFISTDCIVEVKATSSGRHCHIINGIDQLKVPSNKKLFVLSFIFSETEDLKGCNLAESVEDLRNCFKNSPLLQHDYFLKLRNKNFSYREIDKYRLNNFYLVDSKLFPIYEDTPKLTSDQLKLPLSNRINKVRYTLDFEGMESLDFDKINIQKLLEL